MQHRVPQIPLLQKREPELCRGSYTIVISSPPRDVTDRGVQPCDLVIENLVVVVVLFAGDQGGEILVREAEDSEPEQVVVCAFTSGAQQIGDTGGALAVVSPGKVVGGEGLGVFCPLFTGELALRLEIEWVNG